MMGKIFLKSILKIENKILFKAILNILLHNTFKKRKIENKIVFGK